MRSNWSSTWRACFSFELVSTLKCVLLTSTHWSGEADATVHAAINRNRTSFLRMIADQCSNNQSSWQIFALATGFEGHLSLRYSTHDRKHAVKAGFAPLILIIRKQMTTPSRQYYSES